MRMLKGLVYSLTPKIKETNVPWYSQPATLGIIVCAGAVVLNIVFLVNSKENFPCNRIFVFP